MTCGAPGTAGGPARHRPAGDVARPPWVCATSPAASSPGTASCNGRYLPGGRWVSTDESATRTANLGRDVFADPVAAGSRMVLPLVFTVDGRDPPQQLELRSGVFSAGVRVHMP